MKGIKIYVLFDEFNIPEKKTCFFSESMVIYILRFKRTHLRR